MIMQPFVWHPEGTFSVLHEATDRCLAELATLYYSDDP